MVVGLAPCLGLAPGLGFLLALEWFPALPPQRLPRRPGEQREAHIGRALGRVAPSMLLCSLSEAICFFLGEHSWECSQALDPGMPLSPCTCWSRCPTCPGHQGT